MNLNLLPFICENDLIFDIGANHGIHTSVYLDKNCKVISVEPQPNCVKILNEKFNNNKNVIILQKAVSNNIGISKFCLCSEDALSTMVPEKWKSGRFNSLKDNWNNFIDVETITIDNLIKEYGVPKFCKIDVEGHEYEVISGLNRMIPCLSFEYTCEFINDAYKCLDHLYKLGYRKFNMTNPENYIFNDTVSIDEIKNYKFVDSIAWGDIYAFNI